MPELTPAQIQQFLAEAQNAIRCATAPETRPVAVLEQRSGPGHYTIRIQHGPESSAYRTTGAGRPIGIR